MAIIKATATLVEDFRSIADNSRSYSIVCDLPRPKGGSDIGPTALEVAIMSLADCAVTIFADCAKRSGEEITKMQVVAEANMPEDSTILSGVKLKVNVSGKARDSKMAAIWRRTEANCPVVSIFRESIPVEAELEIT